MKKEEKTLTASHYIIMSSSYKEGIRIALDITDKKMLNVNTLSRIVQKIKDVCGEDVPLSTHFVSTESESWESVAMYDPFFKGVKRIESVEEFAATIERSRHLTGMDVANYILSKVRCTHLSLEKLVYFAYADYLCCFSEPLFQDEIYAFTHGPIIKSVYEVYKRSGYQYVAPYYQHDTRVESKKDEMPFQSRILFARKGEEKLCSIDRTIAKYGAYTASRLVELTHRKGSPWSMVDSTKQYQVITDDIIKAHHFAEIV